MSVEKSQPDSPRPFTARMTAYHFGAFLLCHGKADTACYRRTLSQIARDRLDLCVLHTRLQGNAILGSLDNNPPDASQQAESTPLAPGDIGIIDMSRPMSLATEGGESITLFVPRLLLISHMGHRATHWHGYTIRGHTASGLLLLPHLLGLSQAAPCLLEDEACHLVHITLDLIAACLRLQIHERQEKTATHSQVPRQHKLQTYIETHLHEETLNADHLVKSQGISRSQLYRLFEPFGGVSAYIRQRRLIRSRQALCSLKHANDRICEIAYAHGFADEAISAGYSVSSLAARHARPGAVGLPSTLTLPTHWMRRMTA